MMDCFDDTTVSISQDGILGMGCHTTHMMYHTMEYFSINNNNISLKPQ